MSPIRAVLFDFDHTLGIDNKLEEFVLRELALSYCRASPDDDALREVLRRFRSGGEPMESAIGQALRAWGCPERNIEHAIRSFRQQSLALAPEKVRAMPGARDLLRELTARRAPMGILSNGWTQLQHLKAWLINFPGPVLASEEIGASKPDARAFEIALEHFSMAAPATLYVGDDPMVDVAGAKSAGMPAVWADFEGKMYPKDAPAPDFTVTALPQVAQLVGHADAQ